VAYDRKQAGIELREDMLDKVERRRNTAGAEAVLRNADGKAWQPVVHTEDVDADDAHTDSGGIVAIV